VSELSLVATVCVDGSVLLTLEPVPAEEALPASVPRDEEEPSVPSVSAEVPESVDVVDGVFAVSVVAAGTSVPEIVGVVCGAAAGVVASVTVVTELGSTVGAGATSTVVGAGGGAGSS
jgi:hypothetical protein